MITSEMFISPHYAWHFQGSKLEDDIVIELLDELSKKIPHTSYETFCYHLNRVDYNEATKELDRFSKNYTKALRYFLQEWMNNCDRTRTRAELEDALRKAKLGGLISIVDNHFAKGELIIYHSLYTYWYNCESFGLNSTGLFYSMTYCHRIFMNIGNWCLELFRFLFLST